MTGTVLKGWRAKIFIDSTQSGTYTQVGYAESLSIDIDSPIDEFLAVGYFQPQAIAEGVRIMSGTLSEAWVDNAVISNMYGDTITNTQTRWNIYAYRDETTCKYYLWAYNCLVETMSFDIPADGFVMHDIDFRAQYWRYGTLP